jgi:hypothetical protein
VTIPLLCYAIRPRYGGAMPARKAFVVVGQRFGRGVVVRTEVRTPPTSSAPSGLIAADLLCDCGTQYRASLRGLYDQKIKSCGCRGREIRARFRNPGTHQLSGHPLYNTWWHIVQRCSDPKHPEYRNYGGRGIVLCERWRDVCLFIADIEAVLGVRPAGMTLDRRDNNGNYEPDNVRWATKAQQQRNRRCRGVQKRPDRDTWLFRISVGGFASEDEALQGRARAIQLLERAGLLESA